MSDLLAAVVVLFDPNVERLRELYESIRTQVDRVWFIDNTLGSAKDVFAPDAGESAWALRYRGLGENLGIASAQNIGIREALAEGCEHVLLLDQDSRLPPGTVAKLLAAEQKLLDGRVKVAAVGPVFIDEKTELPGKSHHHRWFRLEKPFVNLDAQEPVETDWLIASGSLVRASVWARVGTMREELFIDAVDMEWGLRARNLGLKSFVIPAAQISHSVGDSFVQLMGSKVILHGEVRNYYITRNWLYLLRLRTMGARWRSGALLHVAKFAVVHTWLAEERWTRVRLLGKALWDGLRGSMGRYTASSARKSTGEVTG